MSWIREQWQRIRHRESPEDLAEEMRLHLDLRSEQMGEREARVQFGNVTRIREESREAWGWPMIESVVQDLRYGIRSLATSPAFTLTAILSLTIAIGANTAIFSLLNAMLLRALPVKDPSRLFQVLIQRNPGMTNPLWEQIRDHASLFDGSLAFGWGRFDLSNGGERHFVNGLFVSGEYFQTLGVPAVRGTLLTKEQDAHHDPVAVISDRFWKVHFHSDPSAVGQTITLDRVSFQIVGVTPEWFTGMSKDSDYDVAVPIGCEPLFHTESSALKNRSWWWLNVVGRLKPGITLDAAQSQLAALAPEITKATLPEHWRPQDQRRYLGYALTLQPASTGFSALARQYSKALFTLQAVVGIVLLIACANVANLLLARATARQREISVRMAIGAGRGRIIRQLLTESFLLAVAGALGGLVMATWGTKILLQMLTEHSQPIELDTAPDLRVLGFTAGIVVLTALVFGLLPALRASHTSPHDVLKERGAVGAGSRATMSKVMIALQLGLALTLLSAAALFGESFRRILNVDTGFQSHNLIAIHTQAPQAQLSREQRTLAFDQALERLRHLPGVQSASRSWFTPVSRYGWDDDMFAEQPDKGQSEKGQEVFFNRASPGYFQTIGAKLVAGRDFDDHLDGLKSQPVVILGQSAARDLFGKVNAIDREVSLYNPREKRKNVFRVVGIVNDIKYGSLAEQTRRIGFFPLSQDKEPPDETSFELRLTGSGSEVLPLARAALMDTNKNLSLEFLTMDSLMAESIIQQRLVATVSSVFGVIALVLAATGLYGAVAYATARKRAEIGLRMALGATYQTVLWFVLREMVWTLIAGAALGLLAACAASSMVKSLVFGIEPADPGVLAAAVSILVLTAALAAFLPARRAAKLDPLDSLRAD